MSNDLQIKAGTPLHKNYNYIAPEMPKGNIFSPAADIYSLGQGQVILQILKQSDLELVIKGQIIELWIKSDHPCEAYMHNL